MHNESAPISSVQNTLRKEESVLATKAYLMIRIKKELAQYGQKEDLLAELEAIPEVKYIEQVDGACDLLVQIEAPIRAIFPALKVKALDLVEHVSMLKVEPFSVMEYLKPTIPGIVKLPRRKKAQVVDKAEQYLADIAAKSQPVGKEFAGTKR